MSWHGSADSSSGAPRGSRTTRTRDLAGGGCSCQSHGRRRGRRRLSCRAGRSATHWHLLRCSRCPSLRSRQSNWSVRRCCCCCLLRCAAAGCAARTTSSRAPTPARHWTGELLKMDRALAEDVLAGCSMSGTSTLMTAHANLSSTLSSAREIPARQEHCVSSILRATRAWHVCAVRCLARWQTRASPRGRQLRECLSSSRLSLWMLTTMAEGAVPAKKRMKLLVSTGESATSHAVAELRPTSIQHVRRRLL